MFGRKYCCTYALAVSITLNACGGGGSAPPTGNPPIGNPPPTNTPPPSGTELMYGPDPVFGGLRVSTIDQSNGTFTAPVSATQPLFSNFGMATSPVANVVYIASGSVIGAWGVADPTGTLNGFAGAGPSTNAAPGNGISVAPDGKYLYLPEGPDSPSDGINGTIQEYVLDSTGRPQAASYLKSSTVSYFGLPAMDPLGRFLYVSSGQSAGFGISVFAIDSASGTLTEVPGSPFLNAFSTNCSIQTITPEAAGRFVYATFGGICAELGVAAFSLDGTTGALASVPGSPFTLGFQFAVSDPTGNFFYAVSNGAITILAVDPATGALSLINSLASSGPASTPLLDPSGKYLYVSNTTPRGVSQVLVFGVDSATGSVSLLVTVTVPANYGPTLILRVH